MSEGTKPAVQETVRVDQRKKRRKRLRKIGKIAFVLLLIAALSCAGILAYNRITAKPTITYVPYTASIGTISNALSFSGNLQLINNETYSASAQAEVRNVYVTEGAVVSKGDKLLRLSTGEIIKAEFDGLVNQLFVQSGDKVGAGASLIQIADFTHMKVSIRIDEYDINDVFVGQTCRITATATEQSFDTSIASINYISSSTGNVAYYTALAYVDVYEGLYPGMQVTVSIPQEEAQNVVVLKIEALNFDETNQAYFGK